MAEETQQQNEASQPPPLTQGRMYQWISVDDRLPEGMDMVLAVHKDAGGVSIIYFDTKRLRWIDDSNFNPKEQILVTHWMPLPEYPTVKPVPHTPAPAVSDSYIEAIAKEYAVNFWKEEKPMVTYIEETKAAFIAGCKAAATPAPIASDEIKKCNCGICCECLDIKVGDYVKREGEGGYSYEYEVSTIDEGGKAMCIESDNAYPDFQYIMADDCLVTKRNNRTEVA